MDTKEMIEVMQAFAQGKEIEVNNLITNEWELATQPCWDWSEFEYRVKPPEPSVAYANVYHDGLRQFRDTANECKEIAGSDVIRVAVKYQEVIK